jgi:hypothetical protein
VATLAVINSNDAVVAPVVGSGEWSVCVGAFGRNLPSVAVKMFSHLIYFIKYMFMSSHQTAGQSNDITVAKKSFEKVAKFKYLGSTLTDQNFIHEEIRSRLNSGNACYHTVQKLLSSHLQSRNVKIKIYKTIILPVVLYGCEPGLSR